MHSVLVTGGTGSFGQAFVKRILEEERVKRVVIYSRDELKQFETALIVMRLLCVLFLCVFLAGDVKAQQMMHPGAYGYGPFHWGSGRYWGGWGGFSPGPRYYNPGAYRWNGISRWRYGGY